ncbi:MAG: BamA/TamA family outer membrane protein [Bacteroidota bacterium]
MMKQIIPWCLLTSLMLQGFAQHHGSDNHSGKNLKFSALGGPGFNPDVGVLIGADAVMTFSTNPVDTTIKRSVVPFAMAYFIKGGGLINIRPQLFVKKDRIRIFGIVSYLNQLDNYYGVGFDTNDERERGEETTEYRLLDFTFNPIVLFRWKMSDFFYGLGPLIKDSDMSSLSEGVLNDDSFQEEPLSEDGVHYFNSGITLRFNYDTRDVPANAHKGVFFGFDLNYYTKTVGSDQNFSVFLFDYRQYKRINAFGAKRTLAWNVSSRMSTGDIPLTSLSTLGSSFDLRGLYAGQYRDKHTAYALLEYRHDFDFGDRNKLIKLLSRTGFVAWSGLGFLSSGFNESAERGTLPNFGAGFRFELQPRINFRIDVGRDPSNNQTLVYLNVTEAF